MLNIVEKFATKSPCWKNNVNAKALYDAGQDSRYWLFQKNGPSGLMLHSVGCAQPSASAFDRWDREDNYDVMVHAFIDANTGEVRQRMKWNYRAWHCGGTGNNTHIGVEMCESSYIKYYNGYQFTILNKEKAQAHCKTAYNAAVELFAYLCEMFKLDPLKNICSHKEGAKKGIASDHGDPEHYWKGLGMSYTMDGFRQDVKFKMEENKKKEEPDLTEAEVKKLIAASEEKTGKQLAAMEAAYNQKLSDISKQLTESYGQELTNALVKVNNTLETKFGKDIAHLNDIPWPKVREVIAPLLKDGSIDGGTDASVDPTDIDLPLNFVRVIAMVVRHLNKRITAVENQILFNGEIKEE